jgi:hypothetical protein
LRITVSQLQEDHGRNRTPETCRSSIPTLFSRSRSLRFLTLWSDGAQL